MLALSRILQTAGEEVMVAGEEGREGKWGREWERPGANVQVAARAHMGTGIAQHARTGTHRMGSGSDCRGGLSTV